jgi:hypothetical protein
MTDQKELNFRTVLAHELKRAKDAFNAFTLSASFRLFGNDKKELAIKNYENYADFVAHLYEFHVGCIYLDKRYPKKPSHDQLDKIFTELAENYLHLRRQRIDKGDAPSWENARSYYEVTVPESFGKHWRFVRNRRNHASERRFTGEDISLSDFYEIYHQFIYLFYDEPQWLWSVEDVESYDWGDIERFNSIVRPKS